jgi:hypothetical protein
MLDIKQLKASLKLYKDSLGSERLKVKESARVPVQVGQIRVLFWMPEEYVLIFHIEDEGLVHAVPLTEWVSLTTCSIRIHIRHYTFAPLPFIVYLRKELLEQESYPIAIVRQETIEKVLKDVDMSPTWSAIKPIRDFLKLVWKRYEDITLSSLFYTHIQREKQEEATKGLVIQFLPYVIQKYIHQLQAYQRAAQTNALKGENWFGVVEEGKVVIYLPAEYEGKKVRIKFFEDVIYEGTASTKVVLGNLPDLPSHEYLEEHLHVEVLGD